MSQCVPGWDLDDNMKLTSQSDSLYLSPDVPTLDYEVAELTWENGHLSLHGLGQPKVPCDIWDKPCLGGTLESIVDQATFFPDHKSVGDATNELVSWTTAGPTTGAVDGLVPCTDTNNVVEGSSTRVMDLDLSRQVESCRDMTVLFEKVRVDAPPSPRGNASSGKQCTANDHNSVCQSKPLQRETVHQEKRKQTNEISSVSTKRRRAAAIHNLSERKRRDKINQRMQTLQQMVPNSSKIDKASMLDEVIDYMKQLQAQVSMMSRMNMPPMTLPHAMQQQLQMSMMAPMMGMGHVIDMNATMACHPNRVAASPSVLHPVAHRLQTPAPAMFDSMSSFLAACQSQPMTMDAYSRMVTLYQPMNQNPAPGVMK